MKRHIIFDLDGTLADTLPGIAAGVNRALAALHRSPLAESDVRGMIGQGARNLCAQALGYAEAESAPQDLLESMHAQFRQAYPQCWRGDLLPRPYVGVPELLETLAEGGARLGVLSNKPHEVTEPMVRELFPQVPFDPVLGFSSGRFPRKPAPDALLHIAAQWGVEPQELTLVGDSLFDARTAQNAGCDLILVGWGYARVAELRAWGAPLAEDAAELRRMLAGD